MKDFKITVSLKDNELIIEETKSFVENEEDVLRCIKNYIEIYVEKGEKNGEK